MLQDEALLHPESHKPVMRYLVQLVSKFVCTIIAISSFIFHATPNPLRIEHFVLLLLGFMQG